MNSDASKIDKYFDLTNDLMFKIVFGSKGNEKLLACLLNALLSLKGKRQIQELTILNPINLPSSKDLKSTTIDIKASDKTGEIYCIEMQINVNPAIIERIIFYSAASFTQQLGRGSRYTKLNKTIFLWILCNQFLKEKEIYNKFLIKHYKTNRVLTDLLQYHFVELNKFDETKPALLRTKFEKWLHILKFGSYYQNLTDLPEDIKNEAEICEVIKKMIDANTDTQTKWELLNRDLFLSDLATELEAAETKGRDEGIEKAALNMLELLDEGDITFNKAKQKLDKLKSENPKADYWNEIYDRLNNYNPTAPKN